LIPSRVNLSNVSYFNIACRGAGTGFLGFCEVTDSDMEFGRSLLE
jgi:hypothetical protein